MMRNVGRGGGTLLVRTGVVLAVVAVGWWSATSHAPKSGGANPLFPESRAAIGDGVKRGGDARAGAASREGASILGRDICSAAARRHGEECSIYRVYHPSAWEREWRDHIRAWTGPVLSKHEETRRRIIRNSSIGCDHMRSHLREIDVWLDLVAARESIARRSESVNGSCCWPEHLISYHSIHDKATGVVVANVPIEPLAGFAHRHPKYHCFNNAAKYRVNKAYIINPFRAELSPLMDCRGAVRSPRAFLFDLGASLYRSGFGGASQSWFVESYAARGILFDRILSWEAAPHSPEEIFEGMPESVIDAVSYFNVPVNSTPGAIMNPLRVLRTLAQSEDFVVFKLDIDTVALEEQFMEQIMGGDDQGGVPIVTLIDEFYFEPTSSRLGPKNVGHWHDMWFSLRKMGVRSHWWV